MEPETLMLDKPALSNKSEGGKILLSSLIGADPSGTEV
jgi:hypothetical protein